MNTVKEKICTKCETAFKCGNESSKITCWCNDLPPIFSLDSNSDCLCPQCLKNATIQKIEAYVATVTPNESICNKAKDLPKSNNLIEGIDYYLENEKYVFTKWFHLKRGKCCTNGCRHCPYN